MGYARASSSNDSSGNANLRSIHAHISFPVNSSLGLVNGGLDVRDESIHHVSKRCRCIGVTQAMHLRSRSYSCRIRDESLRLMAHLKLKRSKTRDIFHGNSVPILLPAGTLVQLTTTNQGLRERRLKRGRSAWYEISLRGFGLQVSASKLQELEGSYNRQNGCDYGIHRRQIGEQFG